MIEIEGLTKRYGNLIAVNKLTLRISKGELFGLLGPNGAGKTTTLRMLTGQTPITSGKAQIHGMDVAHDSVAIRSIMGYLPERPFLYEKMTGREYLDFVGSVYRLQHSAKVIKIDCLLGLFDMAKSQNDLVETYSSGMRKKIAICSTLLHNPRLLIWDQAMGDLDAQTNFTVRQLLRGLCRRGITVLLTTHILESAEVLCDRVGIINEGRLEAVGSLDDLRDRPDQSLEKVFLKLIGALHVEKVEEALNVLFADSQV